MHQILISLTKIIFIFNVLINKSQTQVTVSNCTSPIYCQGRLLHTVQMARIFNDSKTFVDLALVNSIDETLANFELLGDEPSREEIRTFVQTNFETASELETFTLTDFNPNPKFLNQIQNSVIKDFARNLVGIWPTLARKVKSEVFQKPEKFSLIPVPNGFIAPGGRFKEFYYWDTYWIIRGLLISEMSETVRGILDNFINLVELYGFIPNGGRIYYLNRSQPPLLTLMAYEYFRATKDLKWLKKNIKSLEQEMDFWFENRMVEFEKSGIKHILAQYVTRSYTPRPESYFEDVTTGNYFQNDENKRKLYSNLKSGAESGWDFTTRWIFDENGGNYANLSRIETERVVPVDLNAFLCKNFEIFSIFQTVLGNKKRAKFWFEQTQTWKKSIEQVFYDEIDGIWYDYDLELGKLRKLFYASNLIPLWTESYSDNLPEFYSNTNSLEFYSDNLPENVRTIAENALNYLERNGLLEYDGGIPTSLTQSGEQWDFPNAWAPLQAMIIFGLEKTGLCEAKRVAESLAKKWLRSNLKAFDETNEMFEKYDAVNSGGYGGGGEYMVQSGFGWTNGVALELIEFYYVNSTGKCL